MINYSFIIPHHNTPDLLERCVKSIPQRDDIEIIVVDDNSDEDKKPTISREGVIIILLDATHSKGAGRARNTGLKHAKGKWVFFADADDQYTDELMNLFEKDEKSDLDVLYFNSAIYDSKTNKIIQRESSWIQHYIEASNSEVHMQWVKFQRMPWNKMLRRDFIERFQLRFQECPNGNDAMFSYHVAVLAQSVSVISSPIYLYTINPNGITHRKRTNPQILSNLENLYKKREFLSFFNYGFEKPSLIRILKINLKKGEIRDVCRVLWIFLLYYRRIIRNRKEYIDIIKPYLR